MPKPPTQPRNALTAPAPGVSMAYDRNRYIDTLLRQACAEDLTPPRSEPGRDRGGSLCLNGPIERGPP